MNSNNNGVKPKAAASETGLHMKSENPMVIKAKEAIKNHVWEGKGWVNVLPPKYADNPNAGLEAKYVNYIVSAFEAAIKEGFNEAKTKKFVGKYLDKVFSLRLEKTKEMKAKANAAAAEKQAARSASVGRSKTSRATGDELAAKKQAMINKAQAQLDALKSKATIEKRRNEVAAALAGKNLNSLTPAQLAHYRGRASTILKHNAAISLKNVAAKNKTLRSASRLKAAATNNNGASVVSRASTRRNYKKEISISDFCKEGMALQEKTTAAVTVRDVLDHLAAGRAAAKKATSSKTFKTVAADAAMFTADESNDE